MRSIAKAVSVLEKGLEKIEKKLEGTRALVKERDTIKTTLDQLRPLIKDLPATVRKGGRKTKAAA